MQYPKQKQTQRNIITVDEFRAITENESTLQNQCEEYLEFLKYDFIRIPSSVYAILFGAKSKLTILQKRFIAKYLKGLSDLTILKPLTDKYALEIGRASCRERV